MKKKLQNNDHGSEMYFTFFLITEIIGLYYFLPVDREMWKLSGVTNAIFKKRNI